MKKKKEKEKKNKKGSEVEPDENESDSDNIESEEEKEDEKEIDFDAMINQNIMSYFCCVCCPNRLQNKCAMYIHFIGLIFIIGSLVFSIINFVIGPNPSMYRERSYLKLDADYLLKEHNIVM